MNIECGSGSNGSYLGAAEILLECNSGIYLWHESCRMTINRAAMSNSEGELHEMQQVQSGDCDPEEVCCQGGQVFNVEQYVM